MPLSHFDEEGRSRMVDVSAKDETVRVATAEGKIFMKPETLKLILDGRVKKGNVFEVARVAAVMGVKQTGSLIPMCHPLMISAVDVYFEPDEENSCVNISVTVKITGKTGVEMEALNGVSIAALTLYDMCKAADKEMIISDIMLMKKTGGKSGTFERSRG